MLRFPSSRKRPITGFGDMFSSHLSSNDIWHCETTFCEIRFYTQSEYPPSTSIKYLFRPNTSDSNWCWCHWWSHTCFAPKMWLLLNPSTQGLHSSHPVNRIFTEFILGFLQARLCEGTDVVFFRTHYVRSSWNIAWWRHQMESFSALLALCVGNSPFTGELSSQRPWTRSFDVLFGLCLNKRLSKHSWGWWFETPSSPWRRHSNGKDSNDSEGTDVVCLRDQTWLCVYCWCQTPEGVVSPRRAITRATIFFLHSGRRPTGARLSRMYL